MSELLGIYPKMSATDYHSSKGYIGSSLLPKMERSPKHFLHAWTSTVSASTPSQDRGTFFHDLLLEQNISKYVPRPLSEKGSLIASNTQAYKDFLILNEGKTPIHPDDYKDMNEMLTSFCENKKAMAMLSEAKLEHSIFVRDPETGLLLKARPDIWGEHYISDLKSTSNLNNFEKQIFTLMYDVRLIHYAKVIEIQTGRRLQSIFFNAFESSAPYCSENFVLSAGDRSTAEDKWHMIMNQISVCSKENNWPGPSEDIKETARPKYLMDDVLTFEGVG